MHLIFNPEPGQCQQVAYACMGTPEKSDFLNRHQPCPAPSVADLARSMQNKQNIVLSAAAFTDEYDRPAGFFFCGDFFRHHAGQVPHLGFGLSQEFTGHGHGADLLGRFIDELRRTKLATQLYGHCYAKNRGACRTMERARMTGRSIGVQPYSHGNEVMEYYIKL